MEKNKKPKLPVVLNIPKTYGPNKFEIPNKDRQLLALGYKDLDEKTKLLLTEGMDEFYSEIRIPKKSEWLWDHKESGQSFKNYSTGMINSPSKTFQTVYIQNLDKGIKNNIIKNSFLTDDIVEHLRTVLELYYPGIKARVTTQSPVINFETLGVDSRYNDPYFQYHAGQTVDKLSKKIPKDGLLIVGLTEYDLYPREEWNFVFGLASKEAGCGVFSFRRYYDEMAYMIESIDDSEVKLLDLVTKLASRVMIHETGHLFGLKHCIYFNCLMNGSNNFQENLAKPYELCPVCLRKMQFNLKFDIIKRFESLRDGLTNINSILYKEEIDWYVRRIEFLKSNCVDTIK
jgi:archaemetzincin